MFILNWNVVRWRKWGVWEVGRFWVSVSSYTVKWNGSYHKPAANSSSLAVDKAPEHLELLQGSPLKQPADTLPPLQLLHNRLPTWNPQHQHSKVINGCRYATSSINFKNITEPRTRESKYHLPWLPNNATFPSTFLLSPANFTIISEIQSFSPLHN